MLMTSHNHVYQKQGHLLLRQSAVLHNVAQIRSRTDRTLIAVIKDNGYGTGETFDWSLAGGVTRPYLLAGGLTPENIPEAIRCLHPFGLDISSGVETGKKKDPAKIRAAVSAARRT